MKSFLKIIGVSAVIVLLLFVGTFAYITSFYGAKNIGQYDCAVVFGAAVWPGGNPSHALADRTYEAIDVYKNGEVACLIFSGADSAYGKHEVEVMKDIAQEEQIPLSDMEFDYEGGNTKDTIDNLDKNRSYVFVSNDFHLARINLLARQAHLEDTAVRSSEYRLGRYTKESFFIFREIVAFWYYALFV